MLFQNVSTIKNLDTSQVFTKGQVAAYLYGDLDLWRTYIYLSYKLPDVYSNDVVSGKVCPEPIHKLQLVQ